MFSLAAINDTDSREHWEPLAPTKEAQEFHLTQTYHDGLAKLQAKEYDEARQLLESVLKDPLISNAQVDSNGSDGHLLQLRFLALKNLATVFLQQGSSHYESALRCYLQAAEIDTKDSVVWNQLGTLSCSMGLLSISRWAFEQGLLCSPNNWNCMEKLLEVLIAIGDEVACLSVAELILRHWPSHSRALHVKNTIEESEPVPFAPRGIDKLEPKHVRLKFLDKRKAIDENLDDTAACKRVKQNIELNLSEVSWASLIDALLGMILPLNGYVSENSLEKPFRSGDVRLTINLPSSSEIVMGSAEKEVLNSIPSSESICTGDYSSISVKEKDLSNFDEQPHERRSSRLERLRSRKPEKEEMDFANSKDLAKILLLEPFIVSRPENKESDDAAISSASCTYQTNVLDSEHHDVCVFIRETSQNYGAYHVAHMLLEWAASKAIVYQDAFIKLLELEKLTRDWGQDRTPECSLFLAELYYDIGSFPSNASRMSEFMSEVSYHLCKIIESVALDYPFHLTDTSGSDRSQSRRSSEEVNRLLDGDFVSQDPFFSSASLANKSSFWTRYFWLSGKLSILDGNKTKAHEEFRISLSLLSRKENMNDSNFSVSLTHLKMNKELTINKVLHEINLLKVDFFLEKTVGEMIEKEMYVECINLLAPLLCSTANAHIVASPLPTANKKGEEFTSIELSALDILIKAFEKVKPIDTEIYFNCHRRKLQILMAMAGMDEYKSLHHNSGLKPIDASDIISKENPDKNWNQLVADEVKEISQCVSSMKSLVDPTVESNGIVNVMGIISNIQSLLLAVMCHVAVNYLCQKPSAPVIVGEAEKKHRSCFVDAGIAFCKLQHLIPTIPIKNQVELIVATHELLAEYGLCCGGEDSKGEEGTFLKYAIKHLFALDMKLKSNSNASNNEKNEQDKDLSPKTSNNDLKSNLLDLNLDGTEIGASDDDVSGGTPSKDIKMPSSQENVNAFVDSGKQSNDEGSNDREKTTEHFIEWGNELNEEEREELEVLIDNALDQCFFCLYGLNIRSDSSYEDDLAIHKNTSRGDYQTKEQCADVFQYILPYAKASSKTGLVKLRRVLKAIRKHFPQPPEDVLAGNAIDKFLDDPDLCEDKLSDEAGSEDYLETITNIIFPDAGSIKQHKAIMVKSSEPYFDIYCNLYYFLALSEDISATDKWPGFVLTNEGEEFVEQNANLFKYDLLYNPLRFESWQKLANLYDEEVDLLLNDGSKHINVAGWRKNATLPQRVDTSRRRSRRCLLMSLALAKTSDQQCEIHELLALVYYDSLQNVVPFYDQRTVVPLKDAAWELFCENSLKHFKKAFSNKQDWSHALYMGKLCEKLGYSYETSLSYYNKAITLNPSAVDPFYRMHASRLKLLCKCGKKDLESLKVLTGYSFSQSIKDAALYTLGSLIPEMSYSPVDARDIIAHENLERKREELYKLEEVWHMLYKDCLSALEICVEGDLKHFHKARYMLARGLYKRGLRGDLERAKDELSFCFKSSRSSFTINMWEIDGMVKKGRRRTPGVAGTKKALEVNLPESSRKFITCIRKYLFFYLLLLEETGDTGTLDRAFVSLRADKRFSLCIEDLIPLTLGRYINALVASMNQDESVSNSGSSDHKLEKVFSLFIEQGNLWLEAVSLSEIRSSEISETSLYGYLHRYILSLERKGKLDTLEAINEKIRKRFKNPKLSDGNCSKVCRHASVAWCRSLIISLALITPLQAGHANEIQALNQTEVGSESHLLFVDLQTSELWSSTFEDIGCLGSIETKLSATLNKIKNVVIKKVSDDNVENANSLLRSTYNFYRDSSCVTIPFGVNLYLVPTNLATETQFQPGLNGVEVLDLSTPRKILLWAYALVQGRYASISSVVKHCEENLKSKAKRGVGSSAAPSNMSASTATTAHTGGTKDAANHGLSVEQEAATGRSVAPAFLPEGENNQSKNPSPSSGENQKSIFATSQSYHSSSSIHQKSPTGQGGGDTYRG